MDIMPVIHQIIMIFLIMGIGLMMRKRSILNDGVIKGMNILVMTVTWPMMMITTTQKEYTPETLHNFLFILGGSVVIMTAACVGLYFVFRRRGKDMATAMAMLGSMPNAGFFGIPIVQALYGDIGLLYLSAYIIGFNLVLWTVGVTMYNGFSLEGLKNLLNPGLICAAIGMTLFLLKVTLPPALMSTGTQLAGMNTPLSMLMLGARMDGLKPRMLVDSDLWINVVIKLVGLPLVALGVLRLMGVQGMTLMLLVAPTAMPAAAATQMMAERYGGDVYFSAKSTSVCTLCSMVTMPLILWITALVS